MRPFVFLFLLQASLIPAFAQLQTEKREIIFQAPADSPYVIEPDGSFERTVTFTDEPYPVFRMLRVVGGIKMPGKFAARGETLFREAEFLIDDNLDSLNVSQDRYSLHFYGEITDMFERHAYNRITGIDPGKGPITMEYNVKTEGLVIDPESDFGIELQIYYHRPDRHPDEVYDTPDTVLYFPVQDGSQDFTQVKNTFYLPYQTAAILLRVGGTDFLGRVWMESPRFYQNGELIFGQPFVPHESRTDDYNYWVGINLSTRSWPRWRLEIDGTTITEANIFDRASDIADFYMVLPRDLQGSRPVKLTLVKEPHRAGFDYELRSLELITESERDFEIVSVPKYVAVGDTTGVLVEVNRMDLSVDVTAGPQVTVLEPSITYPVRGLQVIQFVAREPGVDIPFEFTVDGQKRTAVLEQILLKEPDNVYLSSGDEVHMDKGWLYDYFFKWYIRERVGNWYQFRPSYQWSGVRNLPRQDFFWLLDDLRIPYAWQVEGRTLAATRINPSLEAFTIPTIQMFPHLNTPTPSMFRGKQAHENDGGYYYWRHFHYEGLHSDMAARTRPYGGIFAKHRPIYTDHGVFIHYDTRGVKDMADGAARFVANLAYSRGPSTRHTGPSTMFRYLYQAGYEWLGAEQMYGPENTIMSALRGASRVYGKEDFGSLHAVQWGSFPFTDPKHSHRFYMSLAVAYMHGASHINTEEGLWTDEYANDRYSESGKQHMFAQHQMLDYIQTHSRQGELYAPIAVVHGRNDAWKSFVRGPVWSQEGEKWAFNQALESFDLLRIFYPGNILDNCGPEGWFTNAPYGPVDIMPIEASLEQMNRYKAIIFLGWNTFDNGDFIRLRKFVEQGGTLLLGAVHLNSELQPDEPVRFPQDDTVLRLLLGNDYWRFTTPQDIPLGEGRVIYYPQPVYPIDGSIRESYSRTIREIAAQTLRNEYQRGWIESGEKVDFTVWDNGVQRTLYLLNIDWQQAQEQTAALWLNGRKFTVPVPLYTIASIRAGSGVAAMAAGNTSDILAIRQTTGGWEITCQTTDADRVTFFNGSSGTQQTQSITNAGIHRLLFPD